MDPPAAEQTDQETRAWQDSGRLKILVLIYEAQNRVQSRHGRRSVLDPQVDSVLFCQAVESINVIAQSATLVALLTLDQVMELASLVFRAQSLERQLCCKAIDHVSPGLTSTQIQSLIPADTFVLVLVSAEGLKALRRTCQVLHLQYDRTCVKKLLGFSIFFSDSETHTVSEQRINC